MLDVEKMPKLSAAQKAELEVLRALPDDDIDTSDIPPLTEAFFTTGVRKPLRRSSTKLEIDADVLAWLRGQGEETDALVNAILRNAMNASHKA